MNIFRFCGDMSHLFSIIVLLLRLRVAKNAQGKSIYFFHLFQFLPEEIIIFISTIQLQLASILILNL
jgi:hypothetical protein